MSEQNTAEVKTETGEEWWENRPRTDNVNRNTTFFRLHSASFTCLWPLWVLWCYTVPTKLKQEKGGTTVTFITATSQAKFLTRKRKGIFGRKLEEKKQIQKQNKTKTRGIEIGSEMEEIMKIAQKKKIKLICFIMYISSETWAIR